MLKIKNTIINVLLISFICFFAATSQIKAAAGDLDSTFAATGFTDANTQSVVTVQADGKILIGGGFTAVNGFPVGGIARLNADSSLDTTFNSGGSGLSLGVSIIALQPDGKILIGGGFSSFNGTNRGRIARLNSTGTLDTTFVPPSGGFSSQVRGIALQTDGKIIVIGDFSTYGGASAIRVARLNSDGTLDTTFSTGTSANNTISAVAIQPDGNIVIGGNFTSYNGTAINRVARILGSGGSAGQIDSTFIVGTGANSAVSDVDIDASGGIIIAGDRKSVV